MPLLNQLSASMAQTSASQGLDQSLLYQKFGVCCWQCGPDQFNNLVDYSSWTYNYRLTPFTDVSVNPYSYEWASDNNMEFVPMVLKTDVMLKQGTWCSMLEGGAYGGGYAPCTVDEIVDAISSAQNSENSKFLIGWNQPYVTATYIDPTSAAMLWGKYMQPIAEALDLQLVSPTANQAKHGITWMADFLMACYDQKDDDDYPCDYTTISRFNIHNYHCSEDYINETWGPNGSFLKKLKSQLGTYGGVDWDTFVSTTPYWLTETNCNWDGDQPNNVEQCKRVTGQNPDYGKGSIYAWTQMEQLERMAWWTVIAKNDKQNVNAAAIMSTDNVMFPIGRAMANFFDPTTSQCDAEPTNDALSTAPSS